MLGAIENFLKNYPNIISTLSTFGTLAAVIVSLWLAHSSRYSKVDVFTELKLTNFDIKLLDGSKIESDDTKEWDYVISATITNHGPYSIFLNYFGGFWWRFYIGKIPLFKKSIMHNPLYPNIRDKEFEIPPGKSLSVLLTGKPLEFLEKLKNDGNLGGPLLTSFRLRFIQFYISTTGGQVVKSVIGKELRKFIAEQSKAFSRLEYHS